MEGTQTPTNKTTEEISRISGRRLSSGQEEHVEVLTDSKRKRNPTETKMSKNKKPKNEDPTNAQLMTTLDRLADKMDELLNKTDLHNVETELTNRLHQTAMKFDKKIQDNAREIRNVNQKLERQMETVARLEVELEKRKRAGSKLPPTVAEQKRVGAREEKYLKARQSFRVWPITVGEDEMQTSA